MFDKLYAFCFKCLFQCSILFSFPFYILSLSLSVCLSLSLSVSLSLSQINFKHCHKIKYTIDLSKEKLFSIKRLNPLIRQNQSWYWFVYKHKRRNDITKILYPSWIHWWMWQVGGFLPTREFFTHMEMSPFPVKWRCHFLFWRFSSGSSGSYYIGLGFEHPTFRIGSKSSTAAVVHYKILFWENIINTSLSLTFILSIQLCHSMLHYN